MRDPLEILREYHGLLDQIPRLIKASGLKDIFIYNQMGLRKDLYYRRKKNSRLWEPEELEKLFTLIGSSPPLRSNGKAKTHG